MTVDDFRQASRKIGFNYSTLSESEFEIRIGVPSKVLETTSGFPLQIAHVTISKLSHFRAEDIVGGLSALVGHVDGKAVERLI